MKRKFYEITENGELSEEKITCRRTHLTDSKGFPIWHSTRTGESYEVIWDGFDFRFRKRH